MYGHYMYMSSFNPDIFAFLDFHPDGHGDYSKACGCCLRLMQQMIMVLTRLNFSRVVDIFTCMEPHVSAAGPMPAMRSSL
ncbi:unnamed protein product [Strongylus vulgaris]|uniref:Uncharacterized protein n=1 Tax=Strongylus vulgaris TaxID=40348 RepID=A0A3P7LX04_STRVU|nr:unnamed protein product [Strongylus vulgaris]